MPRPLGREIAPAYKMYCACYNRCVALPGEPTALGGRASGKKMRNEKKKKKSLEKQYWRNSGSGWWNMPERKADYASE